MPKPKNPVLAPRLRWSPEEIDRLVREAAMLMLAAERKGSVLTRNQAVALAQHVLPRDRQREISPDYNPGWMASEGRIEAMIDKLRAALLAPSMPDSIAVAASPPPESVAMPETQVPQALKPVVESASRSAKARQSQKGLFPEQATIPGPRVGTPAAAVTTSGAAAPTSAAVEPAPAREREPGVRNVELPPAPRPAPAAPSAATAPASEASTATALAIASAQSESRPEAQAAPAALTSTSAAQAVPHALATLEVDALAGAFRTVATKALAALLSDVLRQPEVQVALREVLASTLPQRTREAETVSRGNTPRLPVAPFALEASALRGGKPVDPAVPAGSRTVSEDGRRFAANPAPSIDTGYEPEIEDEPPPADPNAWQSTPLHALPERTARGASEPPKPTVLVIGLLMKDQQKLRHDYGQKYNFRFSSSDRFKQVIESAQKVDKVYSLVRFIPKELDRNLAASGVPYSPMANLGELRQDLAINPPLPRAEFV